MAGAPYTKSQQLGTGRKKYRRIVASRKTWEKLRDDRLGPCLLCSHMVGWNRPGTDLHHVIPRDRFGDDIAENLVPLCREHHTLVENGIPLERRELAKAIQQSEPAVYAYAIEKLGEDGWLRLYGVEFDA